MTKFLNNADVTGYISQTSVTSSLLKTDSAGKLVAAVAGTDYNAPNVSAVAGTLIREIRNTTGATLTKGTVVYISGATGNKATVSKALATGDSTSAQTFGLCQVDIPDNSNGYVVCVGDITGLDTSAFTEGVQLYLSSTTAGTYTSTKQYAPAHLVYVGVVTRSHPTQGQIEVKIQNGYELDELHNVSAQTPSNNEGLFYETATSLWKNKTIATVLGYTPVDASLTANYVPKATGATTLANSNIQDSGSLITLGSNSYINGALGIGSSSLTEYVLRVSKNITGAATSFGISVDGTIQSDVTTTTFGFHSRPNTAASTFTLTNLVHFQALQGTIGSGSSVTTQVAFDAGSNLTGATNNYGFRGQLAAASGRWNLYMSGSANNYLAGSLGIGTTAVGSSSLVVAKTLTGGTTRYGIYQAGQVQSDVTTLAIGVYNNLNTAASAFTLDSYVHILMQQGTIGATSVVSNQYGLFIDSTMTGATNNYGIYSSLAAGTGRWNLYFAGSAANYIQGSVGLGTTSLTGFSLRVGKNITGVTSAYGISSEGLVQSDVTTQARGFNSYLGTQATAFTLPTLYHYYASQGVFGAGSTVTNQHGFSVDSGLTGATNNYAFFSNLAAASGRWNLYMNGTANNYLAGSLGIGSTVINSNLYVVKNISGGWVGSSTYGANIFSSGAIQSDVTSYAYYFVTRPSTAAAAFTLTGLVSYNASNVTIGNGSAVTSVIGYLVENTHIGGTNNYGFRGDLAAATNTYNLFMNGTANNYLAGSLGIGTNSLAGHNLRIVKNLTGAVTSYNVASQTTIQSDVTTAAHGYGTIMSTAAAAFTLSFLYHYRADVGVFGAGSIVTTQAGYWASSALTGATNNYGFYGDIASGTGRWNLYMNGTANNYMAGALGIGSTSLTGYELRIAGSITGATTAYGVRQEGTVQSDVTSDVIGFRNDSNTAAAAFTLTNYTHFWARQGTIGAGSAITNQYGYRVDSNMIGATNDFGFYGDLAAGSNIWNLYMNGTASNYLNGSLGVGATSINASAKVQIDSTTQGFLPPRMTATQRAAITTPAEGLIVFQTDGTIGLYVYANATWRTLAMV